jgi:hypothetical protein
MPDNDDKKKTDTRSLFPELDDLDDLLKGRKVNAPSRVEPESPASKDQPNTPRGDLPRANAERTRNVRLDPNDQMRDYLNRIDQLDVGQDIVPDDEIHAIPNHNDAPNVEPALGEPEVPVTPNMLPDLLHREVAVPGAEIEWHQVRNLPGYMKNAIRVIGRQQFGQVTRTPIEDITVIAHLNQTGMQRMIGHRGGPGGFDPHGRGAGAENFNTMAELQQVVRWLENNAQRLGDPGIAHPDIPGYRSEIREYTAMGIRFHVVRDFMDDNLMGYYVYAWPEADSRNNNRGVDNARALGQPRPRLPRRESTNMQKKNATYLKEELIAHKNFIKEERLYRIVESRLLKKWNRALIQEMQLVMERSTLSQDLKNMPGLSQVQKTSGDHIIKWLHRQNKLSASARIIDLSTYNRELHPNDPKRASEPRIFWEQFKSHPDRFIIIMAEQGAIAVKPSEAHIREREQQARAKRKVYNPSQDKRLKYEVVAFRGDEDVDPRLFATADAEEQDPDDEAVPNPRQIRFRGGRPFDRDPRNVNIFDKIREELGQIQRMFFIVNEEDAEPEMRGTYSPPEDVGQFGTEPQLPGIGEPGSGGVKSRQLPPGKAAGKGASIERGKIAGRRPVPRKSTDGEGYGEGLISKFTSRLNSLAGGNGLKKILTRVGNQTQGLLAARVRRASEAGNWDAARQAASQAEKVKMILQNLDTGRQVDFSRWSSMGRVIRNALVHAAGTEDAVPEFVEDFLSGGATGAKWESFIEALKTAIVS